MHAGAVPGEPHPLVTRRLPCNLSVWYTRLLPHESLPALVDLAIGSLKIINDACMRLRLIIVKQRVRMKLRNY